jgi:peptidoglycan/LPS O-acetylase OafA/YrhL
VAILLVLGRHLDYYPLWSKIGWIGVDLFFVLSGFLVPGLLFHEFKEHGRINFRRLVLRRGLKIWPAFYTYILITAALVEFIQYHRAGAFPWRQFITTSLFLPNYFPNDSRFFAHIWSLAVEEHFYLILPFVLFVLLVSRNHRLLPRSAWLSERLRSRSAPIIGQCTQGSTACSQESQLVTATHFKPRWFQKMTGHYALGVAPSFAAFWTYIAVAIGIWILTSKLIEMPALRLREKWKLTA